MTFSGLLYNADIKIWVHLKWREAVIGLEASLENHRSFTVQYQKGTGDDAMIDILDVDDKPMVGIVFTTVKL